MTNSKLSIGILIVLFLGVVVALAIIPEISNKQSLLTTKQAIVNESVNIATTGWNASEAGIINTSRVHVLSKNAAYILDWRSSATDPCTIEISQVRKGNGTVWVSGTDYFFDSRVGNFTLANTKTVNNGSTTTIAQNTTVWDYSYCDTGYVNTSAGRSIAGLILLFAAIGLLVFAIWAAWRKVKETID